MDRLEHEIKVLVDGEACFGTLGRLFLGPDHALPRAVRQVNRFFDTDDGALRRAGLVLRLRDHDGDRLLTAKGPAREAEGDGLVSRAEEEIELTGAESRAVRRGETSPLDLIEARLPARPRLIRALRDAAGDRPLAEVGAFRNERRSLGTLTLETGAGPARVQVEMDRTEFPGGRVDHEIEVEVVAGDLEAALGRIRELFREARLEWRPAPSKAGRLFDALSAG